MLVSSSKQVTFDAAAKRNAYAASRPIASRALIKATPCHRWVCSPVPAQRCSVVVKSADLTAATVTTAPTTEPSTSTAPQLQQLTKDNFQSFLDAAGDKIVVVDFFTDWCGPCKLIYPQLVALSAELEPAATIVKFNCNQYNKELAKSLGIKVAPTFHLYKNGQKVADMTGAKVDKLRALIDDQLKPQAAAEGQN